MFGSATTERSPLRLRSWLVVATACGLVSAGAARVVAQSSCSGVEPSFGSSCASLVETLSVRVGLVVGIVALLMGLIYVGLLRTAQELADRRREEAAIGSGRERAA